MDPISLTAGLILGIAVGYIMGWFACKDTMITRLDNYKRMLMEKNK